MRMRIGAILVGYGQVKAGYWEVHAGWSGATTTQLGIWYVRLWEGGRGEGGEGSANYAIAGE